MKGCGKIGKKWSFGFEKVKRMNRKDKRGKRKQNLECEEKNKGGRKRGMEEDRGDEGKELLVEKKEWK